MILTIGLCVLAVALFWFGSTAWGWIQARRKKTLAPAMYAPASYAPPPPVAQPLRSMASEDYLIAYRNAIREEAERRAMERVADRHIQADADAAFADFVGGISTPPASTPPPPVPNG